jgi:hypothetical protein
MSERMSERERVGERVSERVNERASAWEGCDTTGMMVCRTVCEELQQFSALRRQRRIF